MFANICVQVFATENFRLTHSVSQTEQTYDKLYFMQNATYEQRFSAGKSETASPQHHQPRIRNTILDEGQLETKIADAKVCCVTIWPFRNATGKATNVFIILCENRLSFPSL